MLRVADGLSRGPTGHTEGKVDQRQHQPPDGVADGEAGLVLPQQPLHHRQPRHGVMDTQVAEAAESDIRQRLAALFRRWHQHPLVDEVGHEDAQRHAQGHTGGAEPPEHAALWIVAADPQRQLVHRQQQVAEVGVKDEESRPDAARHRQRGVKIQSHQSQQAQKQRGQPQHHSALSSFSRPISRA